MVNPDEVKSLKLKLSKTMDECQQLKILNKKLINQIHLRYRQLQLASSPRQVCY